MSIFWCEKSRSDIEHRFRNGETLQEIGNRYGISREYIRQILASMGLKREHGGRAIQSLKNCDARIQKRKLIDQKKEARSQRIYGMSVTEYSAHVEEYGSRYMRGTPLVGYLEQRSNARARGIEWNLNFKQWWLFWLESGKWNQRGRGSGYVMGRYGDTGGYGLGNIYICSASENSSDQYKSGKQRKINGHARLKVGKGYTYCKRSKLPYRVQCHGKFYGGYATPEEAHEAYLEIKRKIINGEFE